MHEYGETYVSADGVHILVFLDDMFRLMYRAVSRQTVTEGKL